MINLLPTENKRSIKNEYFSRLAVVCLFFLCINITLATIALVPFIFELEKQINESKNLISFSEKKLSDSKESQIRTEIEKLNDNITVFQKNKKNEIRFSKIIEIIIGEKPEKIKILSITYDGSIKNKISIRGEAGRQDLADFVKNLKNNTIFSGIESPPSNLLKESGGEFVVFIEKFNQNEN